MAGQPSPWAGAFRGFDDWDESKQKQVCLQFMHAAAPLLQDAKVVPKPNDDETELRGIYAGYPMRVTLDAFYDLAFDVKAQSAQHDSLCFRWAPDSAPTPGDVDPWDDDDEVRVFLAKCVYVEDSADEMDALLRRVQLLPAEFKANLFPMMQRHRLSAFNLTPTGPGTSYRENVGAMWDPMVQVHQILWLLGYAANVYMALPPPGAQSSGAHSGAPPEMSPPMAAAHRVQCRYCSTIFLLGHDSQCPNCGASYTG
jgi:hypothetical protein